MSAACPGGGFDTVSSEPLLELAVQAVIPDHRHARPMPYGKIGQPRNIALGRQSLDGEAVAVPAYQIERAGANRAGSAEYGQCALAALTGR